MTTPTSSSSGEGLLGRRSARCSRWAASRAIIIERDIHPRDHVGESLTPSTNLVFERIDFLDKLNDGGFIHKPGTAWNAPRSQLWKFVEIWLFEYPIPNGPQPFTYNIERDVMDTLLIRHAHEKGAKVVQGAKVEDVMFEDGRAVGVRVSVTDGWERDLYARVIVDASGRRCFLANKLGLKSKDRSFNQFCIYSWFEGVTEPPKRYDGFALFYFLALNQAWAWHIPLRNGRTSLGVVMDKEDFQKSGKDYEEFFYSLAERNRTFKDAMKNAQRVRPWWVEGDYSYKVDQVRGAGLAAGRRRAPLRGPHLLLGRGRRALFVAVRLRDDHPGVRVGERGQGLLRVRGPRGDRRGRVVRPDLHLLPAPEPAHPVGDEPAAPGADHPDPPGEPVPPRDRRNGPARSWPPCRSPTGRSWPPPGTCSGPGPWTRSATTR